MPRNYFKEIEWSKQPAKDLGGGKFMTMKSHGIRNRYQDETCSDWYDVEVCQTIFLDAVVLLIFHTQSRDRLPHLLLRRSIRPAAALRSFDPRLMHTDGDHLPGALWELPAGGVEASDLSQGGIGISGRAAREVWEEGGFRTAAEKMIPLGQAPFSAPAICHERLHYFAVEVDPAQGTTPVGDGHPMEEGAEIRFLTLPKAFSWCHNGKILDLKTETGLFRFKEWWDARRGQ